LAFRYRSIKADPHTAFRYRSIKAGLHTALIERYLNAKTLDVLHVVYDAYSFDSF
jgi:hypothetical protein